MSTNTQWVTPETTMWDAAKIMEKNNLGFLPVGENDRLVGMVTDRDLVTRGLAQNWSAEQTPISNVMTQKTFYCYDDQTAEEICENMAELQIRRMPVVNRDKRLVGVVSFGDLAQNAQPKTVGQAEQQITAQLNQQQQQVA
jgi:CBS domain-containing protein